MVGTSTAPGMQPNQPPVFPTRWWQSAAGRYLLEAEQRAVDHLLAGTAGFRAALVKGLPSPFHIHRAPQLHKFVLAEFCGEEVGALCHPDALPLPAETVELVVLHHVLDCAEYPHEALKEAARVVQGSGHLLVVGFNPLSLFGLVHLLPSRRARLVRRMLTAGRVCDWLRLLGFAPEGLLYGAFRPPCRSSRLLAAWAFCDRLPAHLPLGGFYAVAARKMRLRPVRVAPPWFERPKRAVQWVPSCRNGGSPAVGQWEAGRDLHRRGL
ncbi:MAG: SAM-dependent methyltransferase [Porticoccaceae bacterium]|nr:MAG: SAM-dependent methyltransferase [Porticoccaceae bacterium]